MPHLEVNGRGIHYQIIGEGKPLILLHGLCLGDLSSWYFIASRYLRQGHQIILYDMRGHGRSDAAVDGFDLETLSQELADLVDQLAETRKVAIGGFSYGGLVALTYALRCPDRVERLALVETPLPSGKLREMYDSFYERDFVDMLDSLPQNLQASLQSGSGKLMKTLSRVSNLMENTTIVDDVSGEQALDERVLQQISFPVTCIYGLDSLCREDGEYLHAQIPASVWHEIDSKTHFILDSSGDEIGSVLKDFLDA